MTSLILVIAISLAVSFICSIMEAVLLSVSYSYVALLKRRDSKAGRLLADMRDHLDQPIAAILTLNTIAHTVGAAVGGALALEVFGSAWIALFSAALTFAVLVFSEIIPKTIGARSWKLLARPVAYVLRWLVLLMKPILVPLALLSRAIAPKRERGPAVSRGELEVLAEIGRREGSLGEHEWEVVTRVMHLDRIRVGSIMTPRTKLEAVPVAATLEEAKSVMLEAGYSRIPVYEGSIDRIVGFVKARDIWRAEAEGETSVRSCMRQPRFVPETMSVQHLLQEMRDERLKMVIVIDEFGGTAGLVALEDVLEQIVGELHDDGDVEPLQIEAIGEREVRVDGALPLREVNVRLGLELPETEHDTLAGFVQAHLGRIAQVGDTVAFAGGVFRVIAMDGHRIARLEHIREVGDGDESDGGADQSEALEES
ncbi:MAG: HlyC/CorC family transporter [Gemmatimonadota bacterium]|nr:MAG: HlyC/CorC family transporter [Gemmatimonadota bacterium]